jgi:hypothetical protein
VIDRRSRSCRVLKDVVHKASGQILQKRRDVDTKCTVEQKHTKHVGLRKRKRKRKRRIAGVEAVDFTVS